MFVCHHELQAESLSRFSRFVRPAAEDEESEETLSPKHHSINGSATNGIMEEGSPSKHAV